MFKKLKAVLIIGCLAAVCAGLAACTKQTLIDEYEQQGNIISVSYDPNGGQFLKRGGITIVDLYNPEKLPTSDDGTVEIKLMEPTDPRRPSGSNTSINITKTGYFLAGWYRERIPVTNAEGKVVDMAGHVLSLNDDNEYYYTDTDKDGNPVEVVSDPVYTYDKLWNFETDKLIYSGEEKLAVTLYAGWVPYYEFEYYTKDAEGNWQVYATTDFDYKTAHADGSEVSDYDTIFLPEWEEKGEDGAMGTGAMNYKHNYSNGAEFSFPEVSNATFVKAYADEACTQEIEGKYTHQGSLDLAHGTAVDRVQKIYVEVVEGVRYRIATAEQLVSHANVNGYYELLADLDFKSNTDKPLSWPALFTSTTFNGKMYSTEGQSFTVKNVNAVFSSSSGDATSCGLFGALGDGAVVKDVTFENITLDIFSVPPRVKDATFALFAGNISDKAQLTGVTVNGGTLKIGYSSLGSDFSVNLLLNGNGQGVTRTGEIKLVLYGQDLTGGRYLFAYDPTSVTVDGDGNVSLTIANSKTKYQEQQSFDINYLEVTQ